MSKLLFALPVALLACTNGPVTTSAPVGIDLKAKSGDVANQVVFVRNDMTTAPGNPYGAFTNQSQATLGGQPSRIELTRLTLGLGGDSAGVARLEQVLTGEIDVMFVVNDTGSTYNAGHITNPTGAGPDDLGITFDWAQLAPGDVSAMLNGNFKVVLRGDAAPGFSTANATANLTTTFTFDAYQ